MLIRYFILLIGLFGSTIQAADMVVIHTKATQFYSAGQLLDSQTPVNLPVKAEITVVFASGNVKTITGPYEGKLGDSGLTPPADPRLVTALADFLREQNSSSLVRGTPPAADNIWWVDISTNKRYYCVAPSNPVTLWRSDSQSQSASTLLIKRKATGETTQDVWPANQSTLRWPTNLPLVYGDTYTVELQTRQGGATFKKLIVYQLPDNLPTDSHKVVWMVGRGCIPQANLLLASLH
jgi:hypothetical protein